MPEAGSVGILEASTTTQHDGDGSRAMLTIENCDFSLDDEGDGHQPQPQLRGVSFSVWPGELIIVAGPVGAGKSTLIEAVLGEVSCVGCSGTGGGVHIKPGSRLAYCAQQPWIQAGTVRDNVRFARAEDLLDTDHYERTLAACALTHDLERLEQGDLTQIGELGVNLSGAFCSECRIMNWVPLFPSHIYIYINQADSVPASPWPGRCTRMQIFTCSTTC